MVTADVKPQRLQRIALFDDAASAHATYREIFAGHPILASDRAVISEAHRQALVDFKPDLIIVDLVIAQARDDGYAIVKKISRIPQLRAVPVIVCSKLINETPLGREETEKVLRLPGVKAALGKSPRYPDQEVFFSYLNREVSTSQP